jgi:uncharacterized protein YciI
MTIQRTTRRVLECVLVSAMNYYLFKLIPPRPTFPADMSESEAAMMQQHFAYWIKIMDEHRAAVYGPVMDPKGAYGIAVIEAESEDAARNIAENDPAMQSHFGFHFEIHQMPDAIVRP